MIFIGLFVSIIESIGVVIDVFSKEARERNKMLKQLYQKLLEK